MHTPSPARPPVLRARRASRTSRCGRVHLVAARQRGRALSVPRNVKGQHVGYVRGDQLLILKGVSDEAHAPPINHSSTLYVSAAHVPLASCDQGSARTLRQGNGG